MKGAHSLFIILSPTNDVMADDGPGDIGLPKIGKISFLYSTESLKVVIFFGIPKIFNKTKQN